MRAMDAYQIDQAARAFIPFIDDLSNWYVRRSRSRFQQGADKADREAAFATLYDVLVRMAKLKAPFMPFVSEDMYRNLTGGESVHLERMTEPKKLSSDEIQILDDMAIVRGVVSEALAARAKAGIKVRQPLAKLTVRGEQWAAALIDMVRDEVNVKRLEFAVAKTPEGDRGASADNVVLDTSLTPVLAQEGLAREIIRHGQMLRREADFELDDRITMVWRTDDEKLAAAFDEHKEMILEALQVDDVIDGAEGENAGADLDIAGAQVHLGVRIKKGP